VAPLLSDEHFSVDGTLVKAWAPMKSFQPKPEAAPSEGGDVPDDPPPPKPAAHAEAGSVANFWASRRADGCCRACREKRACGLSGMAIDFNGVHYP